MPPMVDILPRRPASCSWTQLKTMWDRGVFLVWLSLPAWVNRLLAGSESSLYLLVSLITRQLRGALEEPCLRHRDGVLHVIPRTELGLSWLRAPGPATVKSPAAWPRYLNDCTVPQNNGTGPSFFLRFSLLDVPYINRGVSVQIAILAWAVKKSKKFFLTFPLFDVP
jgi:hypothetical protein